VGGLRRPVNGVVFSGPSLPKSLVEAVPGLQWRPPVRQGDLYRAALSRPAVIGLVDGYFETTPTVWHKEILWAMAQGVQVYGASSIGALRAAELAPFGMTGVGRIFEMFRDGELTNDDEVAVLHGPDELNYIPVTEAMVNIRATLERASSAGVVRPETGQALKAIAQAMFYKDRTYDAILDPAAAQGLYRADLIRFRAWLADRRVDQKRLDALEMLECIRQALISGLRPIETTYSFAHTSAWEAVIKSQGRLQSPCGSELAE
jgi:hypothetical protein